MNKSIATEELTSGIDGQKIRVIDVVNLPNQPILSALAGTDAVNKNNLLEVAPVVPDKVDPVIIAAGTPMPIVVNFTYGRMPIVDVKIRGASNMFQTGSATYQLYYTDPVTCLNLFQVWIFGNDDGSGNLAEDIMYSIVGNV